MAEEEGPVVELEPIGEEQGDQPAPVSRREFLTGALAGGAAGLVVAAGTGLGVYRVVDARAREALAAAESEVTRLQGLVELYEKIEKVGLDGILQSGMVAVSAPLEVVQQGAAALKKGLELLEAAVLSLREDLPGASEAFSWLRGRVSALADGIEMLEAAVGRLLGSLADNPVARKLSEALQWVLDRLPFEWGDQVRDAFDRIVEVVGGADTLVREIDARFLEPVEERWFSTENGGGLGAAFLDPLVDKVLDPLEAHLGKLAELMDAWQTKLAAPVRRALDERERLRAEIAAYRDTHGLPG